MYVIADADLHCHISIKMSVIQTVSMTTDRLQNQLLIQVNVKKISTTKVMENRSHDLKIKSFASKR